MASTLVKSLRITPELWAEVEAWAKWNESSPNAAACALMNAGLRHLLGQETLGPRIKASVALDPDAPSNGRPAQGILHNPTQPFRGVTSSGEPLPDRKPYQKTGKK